MPKPWALSSEGQELVAAVVAALVVVAVAISQEDHQDRQKQPTHIAHLPSVVPQTRVAVGLALAPSRVNGEAIVEHSHSHSHRRVRR
jgi:hypothetical protein